MRTDVLSRRTLDPTLQQHGSGLNVMYPSYFDHQALDKSEDKRRIIQEKVLVKHRYEQEKQNSFERHLVDSERRKGQRQIHGSDPKNLNFDFRDSYQYENHRHYGTESARELHTFERMYDPDEEARRSQSSFGHIQSPRSGSSQVYDPQVDLYEKLSALKVPKINTQRVPGFSSYAQKFRKDSVMRSNNSSRSTMLSNSTVNSNMSSRNNSGRSRDLISPSRIPRRQRDITSETSLKSTESRGLHSVDSYNSRQGSIYSPLKTNERYNEWNDYSIPEGDLPDLIDGEIQELQKTKGALQVAKGARGTIQVTLKSDEKSKDKAKPINNNKTGNKRSKKSATEQSTSKENEKSVDGTQHEDVGSFKQSSNSHDIGNIKHSHKVTRGVVQTNETVNLQDSVNDPKVQYNQKKRPNKLETKEKSKEKSSKTQNDNSTESARPSQTTKEKGKSGESSKVTAPNKDKLNKSQAIEKEIAKVQEDYLSHRVANKQKQQSEKATTSNNKSNTTKPSKQPISTDSKTSPVKTGQIPEYKGDKTKAKTGDTSKKDNLEKESSDSKPKKGILRKTSSFKVIGNSDQYFGYMSITDGVAGEKKEVKRVRYHADHYPEVRPISA